MKTYEIKCYMESKTYEKCWIHVEASSEEEAMEIAKEDPYACEYVDGKCIDVIDNEFVDKDTWEIVKRT